MFNNEFYYIYFSFWRDFEDRFLLVHRWKKPGILGAREHLTAARKHRITARDLVVVLRYSLAAVR